ncbi:MAG: sugar transferase [Phycisphaerae bacterium]|nr:sugar transferase [Phycisphaerae bacterium]
MLRLLDIVLAGIALLLISPFLIVVMLLLRFTGEGEVFFLQERVGFGGKPFKLFKLVTMRKKSETTGTGTVTMKNDPRVLPVGKFLRKTKLNELPQLMNIVIGDMSVVGPRPQTKRCFDAFPERSQREIVKVPPGLTGLGSIIFRDEEEIMGRAADPVACYDRVIMPYKGLVEEWFVQHQGLYTYAWVIILTAWVIVFPKSQLIYRVFRTLPEPPPELAFKHDAALAAKA